MTKLPLVTLLSGLLLVGGSARGGQGAVSQTGAALPLKIVARRELRLPPGGRWTLTAVIKNGGDAPVLVNSINQSGPTSHLRVDTSAGLLELTRAVEPQAEASVQKLAVLEVDKSTPPGKYALRLDLLGGSGEGKLEPVGQHLLMLVITPTGKSRDPKKSNGRKRRGVVNARK